MQLDTRLRFKQDKNHKWMSSLFIKLHISTPYWKMDRKDNADGSKLVKEFFRFSLLWGGSSSNAWQDHIYLGGDKPDKKSP